MAAGRSTRARGRPAPPRRAAPAPEPPASAEEIEALDGAELREDGTVVLADAAKIPGAGTTLAVPGVPRVRFDTLSGEPAKGSIVKDRYLLERVLARGGMGSVWQGVDTELLRPVAIKFMDQKIADDPQLRERFYREAMAAAKLRTPHVVEVYEFGVDGWTSFIVMELLEGEDLLTRLKREKRIDLEESVRIVCQCAKALKAAQKAGIVHRDLKPSNIFLVRSDDDLVVKILDFGVAKMLTRPEDHTLAGTILGSPQFMSPEQAQGERVDHRSDLWSLAAIAFRMITGVMPFVGKTDAEVLVKVCVGPVPLASQALASIPDILDRFFAKAFERNVDARFSDAIELSSAFSSAVRRAAKRGGSGSHVPDAAPGGGVLAVTRSLPPSPRLPAPTDPGMRVLLAAALGTIAVALAVSAVVLSPTDPEPAAAPAAVAPEPRSTVVPAAPLAAAPTAAHAEQPAAPVEEPEAPAEQGEAAAPSTARLRSVGTPRRRRPPSGARPARPAADTDVGRDNWGY
jgi:serine/threonine-protein kinase